MDFPYFSLKHIPSDFIKFQVTSWNLYVQNIFNKTKTFQGKTTGQDLLDEIFKYINIIERAYFGLRYQDNDNQTVTTRYNTNKNSSLAAVLPLGIIEGDFFLIIAPEQTVILIGSYEKSNCPNMPSTHNR